MKNDLIYIQWTNDFGGLEKISEIYEKKFHYYNPLVVILRYNKNGLDYKNHYAFKKKSKLLFVYSYLLFIFKNRQSIFHIQYAGSAILLFTFLAGASKLVFHYHGTQFPNRFLNKLTWKLLENKVILIANSLHTEKLIRDKLKIKSQIKIIPNLIDFQRFRFSERTQDKNKFLITFVGRFELGKNVDLIVDIAKITSNKDDEVEFLLVGDGPEKRNIEMKIKRHSLESKVKILPFTNEIMKIYSKSNLFLFVSSFESFGNVVAEAIFSGLPILCYKIPALSELVNDDLFFIKKLDPNIFAVKIIEFKKNYKFVNQRLKKVYQHLSEYLNEEKIIKELDEIYQSLIYNR
jgi:glycosyltransferase involved in cell wall biosynthesis